MRIITLFTPAHGVGRTTTTMALACGFLALGKRVLVMDNSGQQNASPEAETELERWHKAMSISPVHNTGVELTTAANSRYVIDKLLDAAGPQNSYDAAIVDTSAEAGWPQWEAITRADLILSPVFNATEAKLTAKAIREVMGESPKVRGMVARRKNGKLNLQGVQNGFDFVPLLRTELPFSEAISDQATYGDIGRFTKGLKTAVQNSDYNRFKDAQEAWNAVMNLAVEVQWAIDGYQLVKHQAHN